ncbi:MAG: hypothetical protein RDV48_21640 [Candidatus Eremiobacteraeota bacterium]|nr:hypothetical protein [Candidatus Eremiobacteraeota bacterium]
MIDGEPSFTAGASPSMPSPWIEVPDDWLDDEYSNHSGYRVFQEYFGLRARPGVINEYLLGSGICNSAQIEVERFSAKEISGRLKIKSTMKVTGPLKLGGTGTDKIRIHRTIDNKICKFDLMDASRVRIEGFGVEYYRRVIPLLRKLGIETIKTDPTTTAERSKEEYNLIGAYVWSFYGYSNDDMKETLNQYADYLKKVRGIKLTPDRENKIMSITRMCKLAKNKLPNGEKTGKKFLMGMDAHDKPIRPVWWSGTHQDINDESTDEMSELIDHLLDRIKQN